MSNTENVVTVERVVFLNNVAFISVSNLSKIFFRNKDPSNIFRLMCLMI